METSTILTIFGIIATAVFFALGTYLTVKRRYTAQITFIKEDSLGLFDSIVKNLPELAVLYRDNPVSQGLVLLKGFLLNTGAKDITEPMVEEPLSIKLPEGFQWLTGRVVSASSKVQAKVNVKPSELTLQTGLFRCNEHIRFEALAEVPIEEGETATENQDMGKK
jgi:hypothetical protein